MPDTDGANVLRRLRASGKHTPVLVLSAREAVDERVRLLDLGADDYVVKPIALNELEARIRSLIRRSHGISGEFISSGSLDADSCLSLIYLNTLKLARNTCKKSFKCSLGIFAAPEFDI